MRRVRIDCHSQDLIAGFVAGVEWVDDSAIAVADLDYRVKTPFVILKDGDRSGAEETLNLTGNGIDKKE